MWYFQFSQSFLIRKCSKSERTEEYNILKTWLVSEKMLMRHFILDNWTDWFVFGVQINKKLEWKPMENPLEAIRQFH